MNESSAYCPNGGSSSEQNAENEVEPTVYEVRGGWAKLHSEKHCKFYLSLHVVVEIYLGT
jgi:hypothetical protein